MVPQTRRPLAPPHFARRTVRVRIGILMQRARVSRESFVPGVATLLERQDAAVEILDPAERITHLHELRVEHDLYVLKDKSDLGLSVAGALHVLGATLLNSYPVSLMLRDKIVTSRALHAAGIPTPETFVAARTLDFAPLLREGPLVVKPFRSSRGRDERVVRFVDEFPEPAVAGEPAFAQRYLPHDGPDLKLYAIGAELFGVERQWPAVTYEQKLGKPIRLTPDLVAILERCREALGLHLFGVDVIRSRGRPYVVDASSFPGFKGAPDAETRLARFLFGAAERAALRDHAAHLVRRVVGGERR